MNVPESEPRHVVVMGVSATGKSTVAQGLADGLAWQFLEGDDYHSPANVAKMSAGVPLTDADRLPWLETLAGLVRQRHAAGGSTVLTCSALRRKYRDLLRGGAPAGTMFFVHLHAPFEVLEQRMASRRRHFMPGSLLRSQFDALQPLEEDEQGAVVDVSPPVDAVVATAVAAVRAWLAGTEQATDG